ncbi:MAG TPA: D-2-hydroxyacid dehydrogenase [Candidatus Acidoferrales bacterium]|nr:D-2-hydroxyacid dehydrogenase [Candidatus Acidoferrales bacterium]
MNRTTPAGSKLVICVGHPFDLWRPPQQMSLAVKRRFPEMGVVHLPDCSGLDAELPDTVIFAGYFIRANQLRLAKRLKWIHSTAAGISELISPELLESGILVTNASGVHSITIAEHVLGMLLALARRFPDAVCSQLKSRWAQQEIWKATPPPQELRGAMLLLIGLGAVGRAVAELARAIGMRTVAVTRSGRGDDTLAEKIFAASNLDAAIAEADYVVLAAPETSETRQLFAARQFAAMKPSSCFINVARGSLVDEVALVAALQERKIAAAALDVTAQEPLPPESPLWHCPNLFITPHLAGASDHLWKRQTELLIDNLERWFDGRELVNVVELKRGY